MKQKTFYFLCALMALSLALNGLFVIGFLSAVRSKPGDALLSFPAPQEGYFAAATVASVPSGHTMVFSPLEIALKPGQKAFVQYSVFAERKQSNVLINALYDPRIVSIRQTGFGIEIAALREGDTVLQAVTANGIVDIAFVAVEE
jgi:hypothetical protein